MVEQKKNENTMKSNREVELEKQLKAANDSRAADKLAAEEEALKKVCDAAGIDPESLAAKQADDEQKDDIFEFDIGKQVVSINGFPYRGKGRAPRGVVEMIVSLAANERMAKLNLFKANGNQDKADELLSGDVSSRFISKG